MYSLQTYFAVEMIDYKVNWEPMWIAVLGQSKLMGQFVVLGETKIMGDWRAWLHEINRLEQKEWTSGEF